MHSFILCTVPARNFYIFSHHIAYHNIYQGLVNKQWGRLIQPPLEAKSIIRGYLPLTIFTWCAMICAHCNRAAGLGDSCTHVASLVWAVEAGMQMRVSLTVTQKKTYWVLPPSVKEAPYVAPIKDINFKGKSGALTLWNSLVDTSRTVVISI